ncbi:hypothetical protein ACFXJ8_05895 [Nonomuraea sp. NPDC059194]|uniref:hypothetical protein n=1 Tax=Nonomuraea sp. NPDC059194 TaxID=3346764 RepID=UPI0036872591
MRRVTWLLSLALISGCAAESTATPAPAKGPDPRPRMEQIKADCMKQKGFKYVPYITPDRPDPDLSSYEAMKTYRQKYGFGVFGQFVFPKDPLTGSIESDPGKNDPNRAISAKLNDSQHEAYNEAKDGCYQKAAKEVLKKEAESMLDGATLLRGAREELEATEIDGDPELVALASDMGKCLVGKGRRVSSTQPTTLAKRGEELFWDEMEKLGDNPHEMPDITPEQARPHLDKEVKAALEDLECGKEFYTRYAPKKASISARVWAEYGPLLGAF